MKKTFLWTAFAAVLMTANLFSCSHSTDYANRTPQSSDPWYDRFGACLVSPDNNTYIDKWKTYYELIQKKVKINIGHFDKMPVSPETRTFVTNLGLISPLLYAWDAIKTSKWAAHMYKDKNFVELTSSAAFVYKLRDLNFINDNKDPYFIESYQEPDFKKNFDEVLRIIRDPEAQVALTYFHNKKLVFIDMAGLKSALQLATFFGLPNSSEELNYLPFMKDLPRPPMAVGNNDIFAAAYWDIAESSIATFLETFETGQDDLDHIDWPDKTIPYDDKVIGAHQNDDNTLITRNVLGKDYQLGVDEITAIDGVARTLWGEAASCEVGRNVRGFSAVGLVMANRTIAVENSLHKNNLSRKAYKQTMQEDVDILMNSDANDSLKGFVPERTLGQADFGRPGTQMHAASQIVSRREQFSCWNGYYNQKRKYSALAQLPAGMPDLDYTFKLPAAKNDIHDLVNVLCPTINANVHKHDGLMGWNSNFPNSFDSAWREAVDTATLIVLDPDRYKALYNFVPAPNSAPLFYTNGGINLPGLPVMPTSGMTYANPETGKTEDFTGGTACNRLRVFSARSKTVYGVAP